MQALSAIFKLSEYKALSVSKGLRYGALLLVNIILAKSILSQKEIGIFEYFIFLATATSAFWINGFIQSLLSEYEKTKNKEKESSILEKLYLILTSLGLLVSFLIWILFFSPFSKFLNQEFSSYLHYILVYIPIVAPVALIEYIYLLRSESKKLIWYSMFSMLIQLGGIAVPAFTTGKLDHIFLGLILTAFIRHVYLLTLLKRINFLQLDKKYFYSFVILSFPLIINALVGGSEYIIDGIMVSTLFDKETFAIFTYGAKELPIAIILSTALRESLVPKFSNLEHLRKNLLDLKQKSNRLMHLLFPISILLMFASYPLFPIVFNPKFAASAGIFNIFLLLVISRVTFPHVILLGFQENKKYLSISLIELSINILLSLLLLYLIGIKGVAWGTVGAYGIHKIILIAYNKQKFNISPQEYIHLKMLGVYSIILLIAYIINESIW